MSVLVRNEQTKLLANALNNIGVASIVTGVIAPSAGYLVGTLRIDDPFRLVALGVIWLALGGALLGMARRVLEDLE